MASVLNWIPDAALAGLLLVATTQACFVAFSVPLSRYPLVLTLSIGGFVLGELWAAAGGPAWAVGQIHPVPDVPLALLLQISLRRLGSSPGPPRRRTGRWG